MVSANAMTNTATVTLRPVRPQPGNNSSSATVTPQKADLAVAKTVSNPTPNVGDTITFTITLTNAGPNTATGVALTDLLPAGLTFVSATPSQGTYNSANGAWTVGTVASGAPQPRSVLRRRWSPPMRMTNTATISDADQFDPNTANNSASATVTPQQADLAVVKTVNNPTPNVGTTITFTITLTNAGPDTATGVAVTDLLPAGLTFVSATPSQGTYNPGDGAWTVGTLSTEHAATLTYYGDGGGGQCDANTATISCCRPVRPRPRQQHVHRHRDAIEGRSRRCEDRQQRDAECRQHHLVYRDRDEHRSGDSDRCRRLRPAARGADVCLGDSKPGHLQLRERRVDNWDPGQWRERHAAASSDGHGGHQDVEHGDASLLPTSSTLSSATTRPRSR